MEKAILVVDMPVNCLGCGFHSPYGLATWTCVLIGDILPTELLSKKHGGCPLKPMPKEVKDSIGCDEYYDGCKDGWNNCLREIGGLGD